MVHYNVVHVLGLAIMQIILYPCCNCRLSHSNMASPEMSQIKDEWLDERCAVAHLADIANDQNFKWQEWAAPLGFPKFQEYEMSIYPDDQARKLLEEWYKRFGFKATYQHLMDIFINGGNAELAKKVRDLGESTKKGNLPHNLMMKHELWLL